MYNIISPIVWEAAAQARISGPRPRWRRAAAAGDAMKGADGTVAHGFVTWTRSGRDPDVTGT